MIPALFCEIRAEPVSRFFRAVSVSWRTRAKIEPFIGLGDGGGFGRTRRSRADTPEKGDAVAEPFRPVLTLVRIGYAGL